MYVSSRASGTIGADGVVTVHKIFSYDIVADPGFSGATMRDFGREREIEREIERKILKEERKKKLKKLNNLDGTETKTDQADMGSKL